MRVPINTTPTTVGVWVGTAVTGNPLIEHEFLRLLVMFNNSTRGQKLMHLGRIAAGLLVGALAAGCGFDSSHESGNVARARVRQVMATRGLR